MGYEYLEYDAIWIRELDAAFILKIPELTNKEVIIPKSQIDEVDVAILHDKGDLDFEMSIKITTWILQKKGLI